MRFSNEPKSTRESVRDEQLTKLTWDAAIEAIVRDTKRGQIYQAPQELWDVSRGQYISLIGELHQVGGHCLRLLKACQVGVLCAKHARPSQSSINAPHTNSSSMPCGPRPTRAS